MAGNNKKTRRGLSHRGYRRDMGPRAQKISAQNEQMAREKKASEAESDMNRARLRDQAAARREARSPAGRERASTAAAKKAVEDRHLHPETMKAIRAGKRKAADKPGSILGIPTEISGADAIAIEQSKDLTMRGPNGEQLSVQTEPGAREALGDMYDIEGNDAKKELKRKRELLTQQQQLTHALNQESDFNKNLRDSKARAAEEGKRQAQSDAKARADAVASRTEQMDALDAKRAERRADMEDPPIDTDAGKGNGDISSDPAVQFDDPNVAPAAVTEDPPRPGTPEHEKLIRNTASPEDQRRAKEELRVIEMNRKREAFNEKHGLKEGDRQYKEPRPLPSERRQDKLTRDRQNRDKATIRAIQSRPVHRRQELLNRANENREDRGLPPLGMNGKPVKTNRAIDMTAEGAFTDFTMENLAIGQIVQIKKPDSTTGETQVVRYGGQNALGEPITVPMRQDGSGRFVVDVAAMSRDEAADALSAADHTSIRGQMEVAFNSGGQHAVAAKSAMDQIAKTEAQIADIKGQAARGDIRPSEAQQLLQPYEQAVANALYDFSQSEAGQASIDPMPFGPVGSSIPVEQARRVFGDDLPRFVGERGPQVRAGIYPGSKARLSEPGEPEQYKLVVDPEGRGDILYRTPDGLWVGEQSFGQLMATDATNRARAAERAEDRAAEINAKRANDINDRNEDRQRRALEFGYDRLDKENKRRDDLGEDLIARDEEQKLVQRYAKEYMDVFSTQSTPESGGQAGPSVGEQFWGQLNGIDIQMMTDMGWTQERISAISTQEELMAMIAEVAGGTQ